EESVFIVDLLILGNSRHVAALDAALAPMLGCRETIKLGQSFDADLRQLRAGFPAIRAFRKVEGVVELNALHFHCHGGGGRGAGHGTWKRDMVGLAPLTAIYLGRRLSKGEQVSSWGARPLREKQLRYASLDVLVMLHLYDAMRLKIGEWHLLESAR
ncbi:unnamed protein product, partial [Phaeothamnion confervicola]